MRKTPSQHPVKSHKRKGNTVISHVRGSGKPIPKKPRKKTTLPTLKFHWSEEHLFSGSIQRVWMSPKQFLQLSTRPPFGGFGKSSIKWHLDHLKKGKSIEALEMHAHRETGQVERHNGRHRAMAAYLLGIKSLPVELYHTRDASDGPKRSVPVFKINSKIKLSNLIPQPKKDGNTDNKITAWEYAKRKWYQTDTQEEDDERTVMLKNELYQ